MKDTVRFFFDPRTNCSYFFWFPELCLACSLVVGVVFSLSLCNSVDFNSPAPSVRFPRQEYWRGLPGDLLRGIFSGGNPLDPGIKPESPALAGRFFPTEPPGRLSND